MRTTSTEGAKIHDFIVKLALSRPSIAFKFINGNRNAISTPGSGDLMETIASIYGRDISESLLEIDFTDANDDNFTIKGYISKPNLMKTYRSWQTFIVNGRIISNRIISKAVDEAYRSLIPQSGFPLAILIFNLSPHSIDVNVHPQKTEIRFDDEGKLYRAVYAAITQAIDGKNISVSNNDEVLENVAALPSLSVRDNFNSRQSQYNRKDYSPRLDYDKPTISSRHSLDEIKDILDNHNRMTENKIIDNPKTTNEVIEQTLPTSTEEAAPKKVTPIGQVDLCYIIAQDEHDLYIVDQHAAHERILFDRFAGYTDGVPAQQLLVHQILSFDNYEAQVVNNNLELFHNLGFTMEPSGENEYRLIEIPADVDNADAEGMLREILSSLPPVDDSVANEEQQKAIARNIRQSCLAVTACRAAIKAGHELNFRQMQILLDQLAKTAHPFTCPHGRPTILKFTSHDLAKMFKRTGF